MSDSQDQPDRGDGVDRDFYGEYLEENETVTNDAVAGETVLPGPGDGNDGPTGGSPAEGEPYLYEHTEHEDLGDDLRSDDE